MYIFSMIREKLDHAPVPKAFKGTPIALIVAAILAIIFTRFGGLIEWIS
jgi:electron transport complex protein RnfA